MENAADGLKIVGGMFLAMIVISIFILGYTHITRMQQARVDKELVEEVDKFNKQFMAFNKTAMYGTDVISILNLAISSNKINKVDNPGQELYINVSFELTKDSVKNRIFRHTIDKNSIETIKEVKPSEDGYFFEVNNTYSLAKDYISIINFLKGVDLPEETKDVIKVNKDGGMAVDYTITYSGIADFKRKTFKCSKVEYDQNGRVNALEFKQVKGSEYNKGG